MQTEPVILYAEDCDSDAFLLQRAFEQAGISKRVIVVNDGKAAVEYLCGLGRYQDRVEYPLPCLVLLDINMLGLSGLDVVKWIRKTGRFTSLTVIMLTSSHYDADIRRAYMHGANGFLVKPSRFEEMVTLAQAIKDYWLLQNRVVATPELKHRQAGDAPE